MKSLLTLFAFAFLGISCASTHNGEFYIRTVDAYEKEIVCAIFEENTMLVKENNAPIRTPAWIKINFKEKSSGGGYAPTKIGVKALELDRDGNIVGGLDNETPSSYLEDWRFISPEDAKKQLFILRRNKGERP